jgi:hypothetical protein
MKKFIKISTGFVAASILLFAFEVSFSSIALADKDPVRPCHLDMYFSNCYCWGPDGICGPATCGLPNDCQGVIINP